MMRGWALIMGYQLGETWAIKKKRKEKKKLNLNCIYKKKLSYVCMRMTTC